MNSRRIISGVAALVITGAALNGFNGYFPSSVQYGTANAASEEYYSEDWYYVKVDGGVKLTRYDKNYFDTYILYIPEELDGQKVVEVSAHILDDNKYVNMLILPDENLRFDGNILQNKNINTINTPLYEFSRSEFGGGMTLYLDLSLLCGIGDDEYYNDFYGYDLSYKYGYDEYDEYDEYDGYDDQEYSKPTVSDQNRRYPSEYYELVNGEYRLKHYDLVIPSTVGGAEVVSIAPYSFQGAGVIDSITLPDTIRHLTENCFNECSARKIIIPDSVRLIPSECFSSCRWLEEVRLPDNIIAVCEEAFVDTPLNKEEYYHSARRTYSRSGDVVTPFGEWDIVYSIENDFNITVCPIEYYGEDKVLEYPKELNGFPVKVNPLFSMSLLQSDLIEEVRLPEGITRLPELRKSSIKKINIPSTIENIHDYALSFCDGLTSVTIPSTVKKIGTSAFLNCGNLAEVSFEGDSIDIGGGAFKDTAIQSIEFPGNVVLANDIASELLTSVKFRAGDAVRLISRTFASAPYLEEIEFDPDIRELYIGNGAFEGVGLTEMELGDNVKEIGFAAFRNCPKLRYFSVGGDVPIGESAFKYDTALEKVVLKGKHSIGKTAFEDCTSLTSIDFDLDSEFQYDSFKNCSSLEYINGIKVLNNEGTGFAPELDEFIREKFDGTTGVGFVNAYINNMAKKVVAEVTDGSMTDIEKAKTLHDWICDNARYTDGVLSDPGNHTDVSIFMDGVAVCEGYSRTYNILLNTAGITSWFVGNSLHSWNVAVLDGKPFHIDTTWDDAESGYNWFMRSDEELRDAGGDHRIWIVSRPSDLHSFQPELLPECKDVMGDMDDDGDLDLEDIKAVRERLLTGQKYDIKADLDFNGKASAGDLAAAAERMGGSLKMGDVDGDGIITSADASMLLDEYALMSVSEGKSFDDRKTIVSDVNVDGQINAADASSILGYYTYVSTGGTKNIAAYTENN